MAPVVRFERRGRGPADGQRHRATGSSATSTPATSPAACGWPSARERHGRPQPRPRLRPGRALRRDEAERARPRGEHRRTPGVPGGPVRRRRPGDAERRPDQHHHTTATTRQSTSARLGTDTTAAAPTKEAGRQMRYANERDEGPSPAGRCGWRRRPSLMATVLAACGGGGDGDDERQRRRGGGPKAPATIPELTDDPLTLSFIWFEWPPGAGPGGLRQRGVHQGAAERDHRGQHRPERQLARRDVHPVRCPADRLRHRDPGLAAHRRGRDQRQHPRHHRLRRRRTSTSTPTTPTCSPRTASTRRPRPVSATRTPACTACRCSATPGR